MIEIRTFNFVRFTPSVFGVIRQVEKTVWLEQKEEYVEEGENKVMLQRWTEVGCWDCGERYLKEGLVNTTARRECYDCRDK